MKETAPPSQMPLPPGITSMPDVTASLIDRALSQFTVEVAGDLSLPSRHSSRGAYRGHITTREAGHIGRQDGPEDDHRG